MSDSLGVSAEEAQGWFANETSDPYTLVRVPDDVAASLAGMIGVAVRRCYISDELLEEREQTTGVTREEVIRAVLPDRGSTMSGDFGEILVYFYHAVAALPAEVIGAKKWRLKQDRTKPAPKSDVVHFVLPDWPEASEEDEILCSEVKAKATNGASSPIAEAIKDCAKDRTSRLADTLVWFREKSIMGHLDEPSLDQINRFIRADEYPPAAKHFRACAVVTSSVLDRELRADAPAELHPEYDVLIIAVPSLKAVYEACYGVAADGAAC